MEFEYRVEGADSLVVGIRAINEEVRDDIRRAVGDAIENARQVMEQNIPVGDTARMFGSIRTTPVVFRPGGFGGGGFYEAELNVGEGIDYMNIVVEGSGVHGPGEREPIVAGIGNIGRRKGSTRFYTPHGAAFMRFYKHGEGPIFRKSVSGQPPQDEWITLAQQAANETVAAHIARI